MSIRRSIVVAAFLGLTTLSFNSNAKSKHKLHKSQCSTISKCVEVISKITGDKYFSSESLKGEATLINLKIDRDNADLILSSLLNDSGYTRIKEGDGTYKIINARDIRYTAVPLVSADRDNPPRLPSSYDYHMMEYKLKFPESSKIITRNLRPFLSRYGRVVSPNGIDRIIVQDTAKNLNRVHSLIVKLDQEIDKEVLTEIKVKEKRHHEFKLMKIQNCCEK
ncbi:hypothetical protein A9Q84_04430 [Halobacteriovorax marinus]|uniref:Secretin/TonB short N-terminal domain-containing protein n=1 Tax=Halobacteriovorax marinus TaxID=97084 RepID=A0A1Y5FAH1_9BACT|nr:hypothetical protein A9Q84_04430 [Halobacteriovorax marinus]